MLRVFVVTAIITIVILAIIRLIRIISSWSFNNKKAKFQESRTLSDLEEQAKNVAAEKKTILEETQRNKDIIDNINNTLN